jgi:hypothetical protein
MKSLLIGFLKMLLAEWRYFYFKLLDQMGLEMLKMQ